MLEYKKVSVIVPTFNRSNLLKLSIESILKQDYPNFEIIVTDNASNDNTSEIINSLKSDKIIYFRNSSNIGIAKNHNMALELCTGEYIHIFSDDDIMLPGCISKKVDILNLYPTVGLVHSDINIINGQGQITSNFHWGKSAWKKWESIHSESKLFSKEIYHNYLYRIRNTISMPSVMIRKSIIKQVGFIDIRLNYLIDIDYWLKITLFEDVYYINEKLVSYRLYETNVYNKISFIEHRKEYKIAKKNIIELFPNYCRVKDSLFYDILQYGGYYQNYKLSNPIKYIVKEVFYFFTTFLLKNKKSI